MDYTSILDEMLSSQYYMFLATSSPAGQPWAAPICYVRGEGNMLYFISHDEALHVYHILTNPRVAFSIFDNRQLVGSAFGIQGGGLAKKIHENDIPPDVKEKLYYKVSIPIIQREHSFFALEIDEIYLPDAERWKIGSNIRTQVQI